MTRTAHELSDVPDPAWPDILAALNARTDARVMPITRERGMRVLESLQVTARSPLGALALNSGGLIADHGWFRIFGGGAEGITDLASANALPASGPPPYLHVARDVLGGRFAVDGGGLGFSPGSVCYFGPDTLSWQDLGIGHGQFVFEAIGGGLGEVFADLRWSGWEEEVAALAPGQGLSAYPPLFSVQGSDMAANDRQPVPIEELVRFHVEAAAQMN